MSKFTTQDDCKMAWERLKKEIIVRISMIDCETPHSTREPEWWLEMMEVGGMVRRKGK